MGAVNYFTSDYITLGVKPYDATHFENNVDFMEEAREQIAKYGGNIDDYIREHITHCYGDDMDNVSFILKKYNFYYFRVTIEWGYYEGFTLRIHNDCDVYFDDWKDKRDAQKELTKLKKCLLECAGIGLVQCSPGWCTSYNDYKGTCKAIEAAIKDMREEVRNTPTWRQYEKEA